MARALARILAADQLTVIVNVGDDDDIYGVRVCADLDTVSYTMAGIEGPHGWGIADDTFTVMAHLEGLGVDTTFRLGDRDLATCIHRTAMLRDGSSLSAATATITRRLGIEVSILPATDADLRTWVEIATGEWLPFQEYFVIRGHRDEVRKVRFEGTMAAAPAPGVIEAIAAADVVVVAPSNPVVSIWPILAVPAIRREVEHHDKVVAISPLFGGKALKGPADRLLVSQGLPAGNAGVLAAYEGLLTDLVVDSGDATDIEGLAAGQERIHSANTRISDPERGAAFAEWLLATVAP
jgi:LPPG:FO 2-phospho-L-lactate transferase